MAALVAGIRVLPRER